MIVNKFQKKKQGVRIPSFTICLVHDLVQILLWQFMSLWKPWHIIRGKTSVQKSPELAFLNNRKNLIFNIHLYGCQEIVHKSPIFGYRRISLPHVQLQKQLLSTRGLRRDTQSLVSARKILGSPVTHRETWGAQWNTSLTYSLLLQLHHQPIYAHVVSSSKFLTGITDGKRANCFASRSVSA